MMFCRSFRAFLMTHDHADTTLIANARCKMWSCEYCAQKNRAEWRYRIYKASEKLGGEWSFITLTSHSKARGEEASLDNLRSHWIALRKRLKRRYGKFHFVRVYEMHKSGAYHLHALLNFHFDDLRDTRRKKRDGTPVKISRQIDDYARGRIRTSDGKIKRDTAGRELKAPPPKGTPFLLGYITHAENMRSSAGAAKYITKYMTKGGDRIGANVRRIQASQSFPKPVKDAAQYTWIATRTIFASDLTQSIEEGKTMYNLSEKREITSDDFLDNNYIVPGGEEES